MGILYDIVTHQRATLHWPWRNAFSELILLLMFYSITTILS